MVADERADLRVLQVFVVRLGAALNDAGEPVHTVQERLRRVAHVNGASAAMITAFPTYMMVTMGRGEPATVELTGAFGGPVRLDQIADLDRLARDAERGRVEPAEGLRRLDEIDHVAPRYRAVHRILGYSVLTLGLCLILHPAPADIAAAAILGALVGLLQSAARDNSPLSVLMPVVAAFSVSALSALAAKHGLTDPGLRAMVASLAVFLPGAALTTSVLELAAGQMVSGSARLVSGAMQLALLAFGIVAGIQAVGVPSTKVLADTHKLFGTWAPWLGVLVFAIGVTVAHSAPVRAFPGLIVVLYAAWCGQVLGNALFGGYVSAFVGAAVMTPVAYWVSQMPHAMPQYASFLPGYWLLVPGALGLIGLAELAGHPSDAGPHDLLATVVSLLAVAIGVLTGTLLLDSSVRARRHFGRRS
ncbi:MAG TPA: threonine/serine exporter family protein [Acidimicrobiia bacterium]